ncbi:hypothetical protein L5M28_20990 [Shewanella sp. SW32]|uniref:hypothetical protein n=1 Tax=Shewanella TaxID=22 RepID=UPI0021D9DF65|nr:MULTISPECIES: hypothetical protein [unclassified Shewanella]MCU7965032.1 hypothetical protein [Shewanella sp. SW32]MCU7973020.1 hypothetical protein [Shewanella sp. SW29]
MRHIIFPILMLFLVAGCGENGESNTLPSNPTQPDVIDVNVSAIDTIHVFKTNEQGFIDLGPFTASSDGGDIYLDSLELLTGDKFCENVLRETNGFKVTSTEDGSCLFKYTVKNSKDIKKSAISRSVFVESSSAQNVQLPPLSLTLAEYASGTIDVTAAGLTIADNVTVLGSGTSTVDVANSKINYTAKESGITRILYEMKDNAGAVYLGSIDVAVSKGINTAPQAKNFSYPVAPQVIKPGVEVIIDVSDYISDPDGGSIQLYDVHSFNGLATVAFPEDVTNTKIKFKSFIPGVYYITYTVTDHNAGFASANIAVTVVNYYSDIVVPTTLVSFSAPLSSDQAQFLDLSYQPSSESDIPGSDGIFTAASFSYTAATGFCQAKGGRLPTLNELIELKSTGMLVGNWPTLKQYWSSSPLIEGISYSAIDMRSSDAPVELFSHEFAYVTCVSDDSDMGEYFIEIPLPQTVKTATSFDYSVFYRGKTESVYQKFLGSVTLTNSDVTFTTTPKETGNGEQVFHAGFKTGQYQLQFKLSEVGHPLDGKTVNKLIYFTGADLKGTYGVLINEGKILFNKTYNFSAGNDVFCRSGQVVDGLGVSPSNYVGGTGGTEKYLGVGTSITKLHIRTGDFQWVTSPKRVISYFGVVNTLGVENGCGTKGTSSSLTNILDYVVDIPSDEKLTEVTVYSTGMTGYLHGIRVATEKSN